MRCKLREASLTRCSRMRQMARILRPGGRAILSTPNEHNLANRWTYFTTGFYGDSRRVIDENDPQLPMKHVNMVPPAQLELVWRRAGLELERVEVSRHRALAWMLLPLIWPWQTLKRQNPVQAHRTCIQIEEQYHPV